MTGLLSKMTPAHSILIPEMSSLRVDMITTVISGEEYKSESGSGKYKIPVSRTCVPTEIGSICKR